MRQNNNGYQAYQRSEETLSGVPAILAVYDAISSHIYRAIDAIEKGDFEARYNSITRACEGLLAMRGTLDFDSAKTAAEALDRFYETMDARLMQVHFSNEISICQEVINNISRVRRAWESIEQYQTNEISAEKNSSIYNQSSETMLVTA
jgi:flagellar biosynthetic protein FliS